MGLIHTIHTHTNTLPDTRSNPAKALKYAHVQYKMAWLLCLRLRGERQHSNNKNWTAVKPLYLLEYAQWSNVTTPPVNYICGRWLGILRAWWHARVGEFEAPFSPLEGVYLSPRTRERAQWTKACSSRSLTPTRTYTHRRSLMQIQQEKPSHALWTGHSQL